MNLENVNKLSHKELLEAIKIINSFLEYLENVLIEGDNNDWWIKSKYW